ncbi:MAG TPA: RNA-binding cell elongation regulator Jag/EloR [Acidimicrobiia bacterium]|jgi:spoIIIJ-associated protein|nr:RNA-binding cell elongation regulator Jag/EloR [Acidimicrobiia bacterium]
MDWIEVTARTVDDAKELALDRLGVVDDELEYEVVDEARKGLFGIARADARIRARVKPISREKPTDRKRRRRPNERSPRGGGQGGGGRGGGQRGGRSGGRPGDRSGEGSPAADSDDAIDTETPKEPTRQGTPRSSGQGDGRRRRGGRGRGGSSGGGGGARSGSSGDNAARDSARRDSGDDQADKVKAEVDVATVPVEDQADHASRFTDELVRTMGFSATVRTEIDEDDVTVHIEGDGLGALVGPRGVTIQALEEVVRAVVQHHAGGHSAWIHVDVGGYRQRRRQALAEFAQQVAAEVKETGEERALEPMGAADRKVVHDTVADFSGVDTTSEGEDPRRRVVIFPA